MKLLLEIDVYAAMFHGDKSNTPGDDISVILGGLADTLRGMTLGDLETFDQDLHDKSGKHRIGNAVVDT